MILFAISSLWGIINFITQIFQVANVFVLATNLLNNFLTYVPTIKTWIGYVFFFVPPSVLLPLLGISVFLIGVRIASAFINLIWW